MQPRRTNPSGSVSLLFLPDLQPQGKSQPLENLLLRVHCSGGEITVRRGREEDFRMCDSICMTFWGRQNYGDSQRVVARVRGEGGTPCKGEALGDLRSEATVLGISWGSCFTAVLCMRQNSEPYSFTKYDHDYM